MIERPLMFRAWDKKLLKFHYFPSIFNDPIYTETSSFPQYESCKEYHKLIIKQFTGLTDINGKDIYEGDILFWSSEQMMKNNTPMIYKNNYRAIVRYSAPSFILEEITKVTPVFWNGCEIIGNIFENPEILLDKDKEKE